MDISCAFATSSDTPVHVELAEELGYKRAWLYDSPAVYPCTRMCGWCSVDALSTRRASAWDRVCSFPACVIPWSTRPPSPSLSTKRRAGPWWRSANPRDEPHVSDLIPFASSMSLTRTADEIPEKITALGELGVTELVYQPAGSDVERELRAFASVASVSG